MVVVAWNAGPGAGPEPQRTLVAAAGLVCAYTRTRDTVARQAEPSGAAAAAVGLYVDPRVGVPMAPDSSLVRGLRLQLSEWNRLFLVFFSVSGD